MSYKRRSKKFLKRVRTLKSTVFTDIVNLKRDARNLAVSNTKYIVSCDAETLHSKVRNPKVYAIFVRISSIGQNIALARLKAKVQLLSVQLLPLNKQPTLDFLISDLDTRWLGALLSHDNIYMLYTEEEHSYREVAALCIELEQEFKSKEHTSFDLILVKEAMTFLTFSRNVGDSDSRSLYASTCSKNSILFEVSSIVETSKFQLSSSIAGAISAYGTVGLPLNLGVNQKLPI